MLQRKSISTIPIPPLVKSAARPASSRRACGSGVCGSEEERVGRIDREARTSAVGLSEGVAVEDAEARVRPAREAAIVLVEADV